MTIKEENSKMDEEGREISHSTKTVGVKGLKARKDSHVKKEQEERMEMEFWNYI